MMILKRLEALVPLRARRVDAFGRDRRGVAAVEFAMLAPILITAFIGTFEISEAITINRKTTQAASTVADLVTQETQLEASTMNNIFDATAAVMSPYSDDGLELVVAVVGENTKTGKDEVVWSRANAHATAWASGAPPPVAIPDALDLSTQQIVVAQARFTYKAVFPVLAEELFGSPSFTMEEVFFLRPRNSATIDFN